MKTFLIEVAHWMVGNVAALLNLTEKQLYRFEHGRNPPTMQEMLAKIANTSAAQAKENFFGAAGKKGVN